MFGSGYPTYPNFLPPTLNFFSPFWSNCSSEKKKMEGKAGTLKDFFFDMNPVALRKSNIVYNFGLSSCNRVIRKNYCIGVGREGGRGGGGRPSQ